VKSLLFWTAFALLFPQAVAMRRRIPRFVTPPGDPSGDCGPPAGEPLRMLAVGDSIVAGVGASRQDVSVVAQISRALAERVGRPVQWRAVGRIGSDARKLCDVVVPTLPPEPADIVFVSAGVNDVIGLSRSATFRTQLGRLLDLLRSHSPDAIVAVVGVPPLGGFPLLPQPLRSLFGMRGRAFDRIAVEVVGGRPQMFHIPLQFDPRPEQFAPDGFHPSEASYAEFGGIVADAIAGFRAS
jgi:lysophospholipase L1-like esterase